MRDSERKSRPFARQLRSRLTDAELILWSRLRRGVFPGHRFRRQHPIGPFIADFACLREKLVIEVDGATHGSDAEREYDRRRDLYLAKLGWRVLRVWNYDVYKNLTEVLDMIARRLPPPPPAAAPPPQAGEES